jgi:hypothetical protein
MGAPRSAALGRPATIPSAPASLRLPLILVSVLLACLLGALIACQVHLYADGSYHLLWLLARDEAINTDPPRYFANLAVALPALLAVRLGVTDIGTLSLLLGGTMYGHYLLSVLVCFGLTREQPHLMLFPLLSIFAGGVNASFFIVSESHLLVSVFWPLVFLLVRRRHWTWPTLLLAVLLALPTFRAYESMVLFGPALVGLALRRAADGSATLRDRTARLGLTAWFAAGTAIAVLAVLYPRDPADLQRFAQSSLFYVDWRGNLHLMALASMVSLLTVAALIALRRLEGALVDLMTALACVLPLAAAVSVVVWPESLVPLLHYKARVLNTYVPLLLAALMLIVQAAPGGMPPGAWQRACFVLLFLATAQLVWNVAAASYWRSYLDVFRGELAAHAGLVAYNDTLLARPVVNGRPVASLNWGWTMPTMSILLAPGGQVRSIVANPKGWIAWEPFDSANPERLPPLARYGVSYAAYAAALGREREAAQPAATPGAGPRP